MAKNILTTIVLLVFQIGLGQTIKSATIHPGKGLADIVLETSTLDSVIKTFGKNKIKERAVKGCGTFGDQDCGKENYLHYKNSGLTFLCQPKTNDKVVRLIIIESPCEYKTEKGIGLGNTKSDIVGKYGPPVSEQKEDNDYRLAYKGITYMLDKKNKDKVVGIIISGLD